MSRTTRRLLAGLWLLLAVPLVQTATAPLAAAHAALESSTPADDAELDRPPTAVTLTFNEAVNAEFVDVLVTGPDGATVVAGDAEVTGPTVTQPLGALTASGRYDVAYRVVSADGHPIEGTVGFTVTLPTTTAPTTPSGPAATPSGVPSATDAPTDEAADTPEVTEAAASDGVGGSGSGVLIGGLAAVLVVLGGAAYLLARRRSTGPG